MKGEAIAGTIEDESATTTDASIPASGASTPPTSASDTETPAQTSNKTVKDKKRKRDGKDVSGGGKKAKAVSAKVKGKDQAIVAAKLAKLKPSEMADYKTRAAAKDQTIEEYVLRRIQKKAEKRATK